MRRQCELLNIHRSVFYYPTKPAQDVNHERHKALILAINNKLPFYGYRKLMLELQSRKSEFSQKQVRRLMHMMHLKALHAKKLTSVKHPENPVYPYLLKHKIIRYPNQVWISDLTYIKLPGIGYVYLVAIMDLYSRKVLSWRVSNSMGLSILRRSAPRSHSAFWSPFYIQYGPRKSVHLKYLYPDSAGLRNQDQHGWSWPLAGQRAYRTALEDREVRRHLPPGL